MEARRAVPLLERVGLHRGLPAITDARGAYTYEDLCGRVHQVSSHLLGKRGDLKEACVAMMFSSGFEYAAALLGIWQAGGMAVPLCISHPAPEIDYVLGHSVADAVITEPHFQAILEPIVFSRGIRLVLAGEIEGRGRQAPPSIGLDRRAMILYTSGTTGKPKGAVLTHGNLTAQISSLVEAWEWSDADRILHVLPLHHTHGIVNALLCALWAGATCEMLPRFDARTVWLRFLEGELTLFMAVPTIYAKLIKFWEEAGPVEQERMSEAASSLRLMVSGSAALPVQLLESWRRIAGHTLLERYGMTEIGMALSNPLHGERRPGFVGVPLPGVRVKLVDDRGEEVQQDGEAGEIQIRGPNVFSEYWAEAGATRKAFQDGWFCTGDIALRQNGYYRILGRDSVDIIKTGGYKVSALEVEELLRNHPAIQECAVVGVADPEWGERVCAALVLKGGEPVAAEDLRNWAKQQLAPYKVPTRFLPVKDLPRSLMGKVLKPEVRRLFEK